jgi:hypothetical protein
MAWRVVMAKLETYENVMDWELKTLFTSIYMLDRQIIDEYIQSKAMEK